MDIDGSNVGHGDWRAIDVDGELSFEAVDLAVGLGLSEGFTEVDRDDVAQWRSDTGIDNRSVGIAPLSSGGVINDLLEGIDGVAIEAYEFSGVVLNNNGFTGANGVGGVEVDGESVTVGIDGVDGSGREVYAVNGEL